MRISKYGIVLLLIIIFAFIMSCNDDNDEINAYGLTPNFESKIEYCHTGGYDVQTNGMIIGYFSRISFDKYLEKYEQIYQDDSVVYKLCDTKKIMDNLIDTLDNVFKQSGYLALPASLPILTESPIIICPSTSTYYAYRNTINETLKTLTVQNGVTNGYFPDEYYIFADLFNSALIRIYENNP